MANETIEVLELGEDLLDANNVSDRTVILAEIAGEPVFQKRTITYNDKETGEERSFPKVELKWTIKQVHPETSSTSVEHKQKLWSPVSLHLCMLRLILVG